MIRRPPRSTRTDTLFPYTTLFRSNNAGIFTAGNVEDVKADQWDRELGLNLRAPFFLVQALLPKLKAASQPGDPARVINIGSIRSEERRVGKECVSTCRSRWSPYH